MRAWLITAAIACAAIAGHSATASAGVFDVAVGIYGGAYLPQDGDASSGTVIGAKLRVLPPIPMIGADVYYQRFLYGEPQDILSDPEADVAFEGDGLDVFGADVLIGGVRGTPGFKWYGIAGVNFAEFSGSGSSEYRMGGQVGLGLEIVPPIPGLAVEGRATVVVLGYGDDPDPKMTTASVGVNYYF